MQRTNKLNTKQHLQFDSSLHTCSLELPAAAVEKAKDLLCGQETGLTVQ